MTACARTATPEYCPAQVFPDNCAFDWLANTETPACVDDYLSRLEKQQRAIRQACGR